MAERFLMLKTIGQKEVDEWNASAQDETVGSAVIHVSELLSDITTARFGAKTAIYGYPMRRWSVFHSAFGGLRPGEVTVITAETGIGKTTFALNWVVDFLQQDPANHGVFYVSLEMGRSATAVKLAQMIQNKPLDEFSIEADFQGLKAIFAELNFWYLDKFGRLNMPFLEKAIEYAVVEKGAKAAVIDHLGYLVRTDRFESQALAIGNTMRDLVRVAVGLKIPIILIAHPAKLNTQGTPRLVELDDLKGSADIKQEASNVISLFRDRRPDSELAAYFMKIRSHHFSSSMGGRVFFSFNNRSLWFDETSSLLEFPAERMSGFRRK